MPAGPQWNMLKRIVAAADAADACGGAVASDEPHHYISEVSLTSTAPGRGRPRMRTWKSSLRLRLTDSSSASAFAVTRISSIARFGDYVLDDPAHIIKPHRRLVRADQACSGSVMILGVKYPHILLTAVLSVSLLLLGQLSATEGNAATEWLARRDAVAQDPPAGPGCPCLPSPGCCDPPVGTGPGCACPKKDSCCKS